MNHYETVFILNPVLSEVQVKETVSKFEDFLTSRGADMVSKEDWGLKKMAYEIQNKKSGFYHLFEFKVAGEVLIAFVAFNLVLLLSAQEIACLSKLTVKKRMILSSRLNSVSKAIRTSPATLNSNKW